jgi:hypothetical protein
MKTAINITLIVLCIVAIPYLGLFTTVGIYLAVHMFYLGIRPVLLVAVVAIGTTLVMYGFFGILLGVQMSESLLI